jgi:hypothetical protein
VLPGVLVARECPWCSCVEPLPPSAASGRLLLLIPACRLRNARSGQRTVGGELQGVAGVVAGAGDGLGWLVKDLAHGVAVCSSTGAGRAALAMIGIGLVWVLVVVPYCSWQDTRRQRRQQRQWHAAYLGLAVHGEGSAAESVAPAPAVSESGEPVW